MFVIAQLPSRLAALLFKRENFHLTRRIVEHLQGDKILKCLDTESDLLVNTNRNTRRVENQLKRNRMKAGSSYDNEWKVEEEFDKIYYEFMTTVWKERVQREVIGRFNGNISVSVSPKDRRVILVTTSSCSSESARDMMAALNELYSDAVGVAHSNIIKLSYEGDKGRLARALEQDLPILYPGEKLVARLVTNEDIRIIGYLQNIDHDMHVVESFVYDFKRRHPAQSASNADFVLCNGTVVKVVEGDLTKNKFDAIVSSSGRELSHRRGVSRAIVNACGQRFMAEGRDYIERNGRMQFGEIFTQRAAGILKANGVRFVIHAIAPPAGHDWTKQVLEETVVNALLEANQLECQTVALPTISAGNMGVPLDICAECYWNAVIAFETRIPAPTLKEITFVVVDQAMAKEIATVFRRKSISARQRNSVGSTSYPSDNAASAGNFSRNWKNSYPFQGASQEKASGGYGAADTNRQIGNRETVNTRTSGPGGCNEKESRPTHRRDIDPRQCRDQLQGAGYRHQNRLNLNQAANEIENYSLSASLAGYSNSYGTAASAFGNVQSNANKSYYYPTTPAKPDNKNLPTTSVGGSQTKYDECPICMDNFNDPQTLPCSHKFCRSCLDQLVSKAKSNLCPTCRKPFTTAAGKQPKDGVMTISTSTASLPGYDDCGSIRIGYKIPSGVQGPEHPNPGQRYTGTSRIAYLPDNNKGRLVARLLKKAFDQRLVFTVGQSVTSGRDNCVVWNDIHHKTNITGGPSHYGYPDPGFLDRVIEDLKSKGITE